MPVFRKLLVLTCAAALLSPESVAAPFNNATIRRIIEGREVFIDRRQAAVNQTASRNQELSTGNSRAEVLFDRRALGFLGNNSLIRLGQDCFRLKRGQVLVNGPQNTCLGTKVLGIRGTTYVLSVHKDGTYDLAVLSGEAAVGDAVQIPEQPDRQDILSMYPRLNPVIGVGSSAWGSNTNGEELGQAAGLILGDASFFVPLSQSMGSNLVYSYTTASSNFDGAWGASTELGYKWFNPDNRSINSLLVGYDGWDVAGCFQSQLALGGLWQRKRWQFGVTGGIPLDQCVNNLGFAIGQVGIPVADLGEQSVTLSLSPYLLHGIGQSFGGGRIGVNVPIGNQLTLAAYGQYDNLLDTVVGGQISYQFSTNGGFVNDPNVHEPALRSPLPWQASNLSRTQPMQTALNDNGQVITSQTQYSPSSLTPSCLEKPINNEDVVIQLKAGEEATFDPDGQLICQRKMSKERFSELIMQTMNGQNLLPESHAINLAYQQLYGRPDRTLLSILGSDWMIGARTPYPRLRGANNLVVPDNKLPIQSAEEQDSEVEKYREEEKDKKQVDDSSNDSSNNTPTGSTPTDSTTPRDTTDNNNTSDSDTTDSNMTDNNSTGNNNNAGNNDNTGNNNNAGNNDNTGNNRPSTDL